MVDNSKKEERWRRIYGNDGENTEEKRNTEMNSGKRMRTRVRGRFHEKFRDGIRRYRAKRC